ncbi:hypothetical protein INF83_09250 [Enterobacter cloacae complex sp. P3B]|uniref:T6SS effector BTH_I2691 family protein n=2 Tax=Enterobacter cloacae complex TaxID=354276 RepID=UPI001866C34A|nr:MULTISPECIES: T6SS effector BTH_I2691 family protein [unclassified Enterobacter cloacae complex]MBE3177899.1 hypothetical protein [Enterobacter cloacae complex sp. P26RS]MBE3433753.1 hypothetical protein [Enterobacter cloacae complex sp. P21RS]MBE3460462.1 hypothetical protein [Enterobacter cloacae complex sp. P21C]MBE3500625.1 hypothetical protein [Enterobacter cloacae complex sp. P2B]MBE3523252.1 hypothetical protein [Enterobacter cloacae complex sp. I6]
MKTQKGCKFCIRYGLPFLPVRPAVVAKDDALPHLPDSITVPVVAKGKTAWTGRLLREGYLYIWSESGNRWINYFATGEGYYYPLPENGDAPPDIANGKVKPCITHPEELANASLITLPVKPLGMKNGIFWFCWSEVEWTPAVRAKHEDASYRIQYMQPFDMDAWINTGKADQVIAISALTETVAEYCQGADSSGVRHWSPSYWKRAKALDGSNLVLAAEALSPGKGGIIILSDPVAVAQELSALVNYRLKTRFAEDPEFSRGLALSATLSGLKQAMTEQFRRDLIAEDKTTEQWPKTVGSRVIAGIPVPSENAEQEAEEAKDWHNRTFDERFEVRAKQRWDNYEKYIDRDKEKAFLTKLDAAVNTYNESVIIPMTEMYLAWLQSEALPTYFEHNFDTKNIPCGAFYLQSVTDCLEGMQDQKLVSQWLYSQLVAEAFSANNYILQALVFNNDEIAKQIQEKVSKVSVVDAISWENLMDGIKDATEDYSKVLSVKMESYLSCISSGFVRLLQDMAYSKPAISIVAMVANSGYGLKTVVLTGKRKYFLRATLREVARMTDIHDRVSQDKLHHHLDTAMRRMELDGVPMEDTQERRFMVLIDRNEARRISALPKDVRIQETTRFLRSADDVTGSVFPRFYSTNMSGLRGATVNRLADTAGGSIPFAGCMASLIFQGGALIGAAGEKDLLTWEKGTRFGANVVGAFGTSLEVAERALNDLRVLRLKAIIRSNLGANALRKTTGFISQGIKVCSRAAMIGVFWDGLNGINYFFQDNYGMMIASFGSAIGGALLSGIITGLVLGPLGIAWALVLVFGCAIYMALKGVNDIQKWLKSCLWRKVPEGLYGAPAIYPTGIMEMDAFNDAIKSEDD